MGKANRKANVVLGIALAAIAMAMVAIVAVSHMDGAGDAHLRAIVHDANGETHELTLADNAEVTVETSLGTNVVAVRDGKAFMREADCPNHDCMRQGRISEPGQQIICLPHELWVEIVSDNAPSSEMQIDVVTR